MRHNFKKYFKKTPLKENKKIETTKLILLRAVTLVSPVADEMS